MSEPTTIYPVKGGEPRVITDPGLLRELLATREWTLEPQPSTPAPEPAPEPEPDEGDAQAQ